MAADNAPGMGEELLFGTPDSPVPRRSREPRIYDFRRPNRISKDRLRSLEAMYGLLTKSLEGWLTGRVRGQVELGLRTVEELGFGEYLTALSNPCTSYVFEIEDSGGQQGVIDFGRPFAFFLVERLLGGSGTSTVPERALSPIERMVVRIVAERLALQLSEAWQDHVRLRLQLTRFEALPEMLQIANREDRVLVATVQVTAAGIASPLTMCVPFTALEKFFTGSGSKRVHSAAVSVAEREADRQVLEGSLRTTEVVVSARFPSFDLPMRSLAQLRVGGMLSTGLSSDTEVHISLAGQRRFRGSAGKVGRRLAVRVTDSDGREPIPAIHSNGKQP